MSDSLWPHGLQHTRLPCPSPTPKACSNMSIESVMPSHHLILCHPLLLLPSIFPSIRVFSNESVLHIRWPKYWNFSFSISPSNEYSDWFHLGWTGLIFLQSKGLSRVFSNTTVQKHHWVLYQSFCFSLRLWCSQGLSLLWFHVSFLLTWCTKPQTFMPWCALVLFTVYLFNAFYQFYYFFIFLKYTYTWILDFRLQENRYSICLEKLKTVEYTVIPLCNSRNDTFPKWCDDKISFSANLKIVKIPLPEKIWFHFW